MPPKSRSGRRPSARAVANAQAANASSEAYRQRLKRSGLKPGDKFPEQAKPQNPGTSNFSTDFAPEFS